MELSTVLRQRFGFQEFRPAQKQVIDTVMAGGSALAVMPTGSGKSLCYQLPALVLPGLTLVVSPLIALMKDQVDQLNHLGLPATVINSTVSREQQRSRLEQAMAGKIKLLYIAPERFQNDEFRAALSRDHKSVFSPWTKPTAYRYGDTISGPIICVYVRQSEFEVAARPCADRTATPAVRRDIVTQLGIEGAPR